VRLPRDGAERHGPGGEAPHDRVDGLDLLEGDGREVGELEEVPERDRRLGRVVDEACVLAVERVVVRPRGVLELVDRLRVVEVAFPPKPPLVQPAQLEVGLVLHVDVGGLVAHQRLALDRGDVDAADARDGAWEVLLDDVVGEAHRLEDLRADVGRDRRDSHLGHRLEEPLAHRLDVVLPGLVLAQALGQELPQAHVLDRLERHVGVHRGGPEAEEAGEVVHLARLAGLDDETAPRAQALADEVVVHRGDGEQRRDRGVVGVDRAVGEDDHLVSVEHVLLGLPPQAVEGPLHPAGLGLEADREGLGLIVLAVHPPQPLEVLVVENRLLQLDHARVVGAILQDVAFAPDEGDEAHHHLLADGVDRRVGDLGEELVEVVEEAARLLGQDRERRVVAHGADGLLPVLDHRRHEDPQVLERVAEDLLSREDPAGRRLQDLARRLELGERDLAVVEPLPVGTLGADAGLDLLVGDDASLLERGDEHLSGLEAPLPEDLLGRHLEDACLGGHDQEVVVRQAVARGPEPVAVERRADERPVGEGDRGRAVPGLDERAVVLVEGLAVGRDLRVLLPGLRDEHHHDVGKAPAPHHQELDDVVEDARVRAALLDDGPHLLDLILGEERRGDDGLAGPHPVDVAAQGVDLAVVGEGPERVGERPGRQHVGREAAVDEGERRLERLVGEVREVSGDLRRRQHPLVQDRPRGQRAEVEVIRSLDRLAHHADPVLAGHEESPLELVLGPAAHRAAHDHLLDHGLAGDGGGAQARVVGGDLAPAEDLQLELIERAPEDVLRAHVGPRVLREEALTDRVLAGLGQGDPMLRALPEEEGVRHLHEDPGAVARLLLRPPGTAMVEVLEDLDALLDDLVGSDVVEIGDEADATGVVLEAGIVEAFPRVRPVHRDVLN
jgi:hypothetical protein